MSFDLAFIFLGRMAKFDYQSIKKAQVEKTKADKGKGK